MKNVEFCTLFDFIRNGMNVRQDKSGDGLPITRIETISEAVVDDTRVGYAGLVESDCAGWLLQPGDILFSHINSVEHIGKCAVYEGKPSKLVHGMNLLCLRPDREKLDPQFGKYLIRSQAFRKRLSNFVNKAVNQASVSIGNLKTIPVLLPPLSEQRRIAAILDKAAAVRRKRQEAIRLTEEFLRSVFLDMFGDPVTNPKGWPLFTIKSLGKVVTGSTPKTGIEGSFGGVIPFVTPGDLGVNGESKRTLTEDGAKQSRVVRENSTLVCCIGATIGKMGMSDKRSAFNQQINAIEWDNKVDDHFGFFLMSLSKCKVIEPAISTTLPILKKSSFELIQIPIPPVEAQKKFSAIYRKVKLDCRIEMDSSLDDTNQLFSSLVQCAFRGEL